MEVGPRIHSQCTIRPVLVVLRGSWDLVTRVIMKVTTRITPLRVLITLLAKSHDPPSRDVCSVPGGYEVAGTRTLS